MSTDALDRLRLAQWLSPAFPVGSFAYSHGLETAMASGAVADAQAVERWVGDVLRYGAGRSDAILMLASRRAQDPAPLAALCLSLAGSAERHRETEELGRAFAEAVSAMGIAVAPLPYPVAVGQAMRALSLQDTEIASYFLQSFAATLVSAAVRFVPLGQTEGQSLLARLHPLIADLAVDCAAADIDQLGTAAFASDLAAMEHETLQPRIFRT